MLNKAMLIGRLGADPEVRSMSNGNQVCNLRLATSESWRDKQSGERKERTEWHSVVIFQEGLVKVAEQYLRKGSKVYIEGKIQTRKWEDQTGNDRYSTEIVMQGFGSQLVMLDDKPKDDGEQQREAPPPAQQPEGGRIPLDDEIPWAPETRG